MTAPTNSMIVVERELSMHGLLDVVGSGDEIEIVHVDSPEEGIELIGKRDPFSIIWSTEKFKNSKLNGRDFLKSCNKHSPLSSRYHRSPNRPCSSRNFLE